MQTKLVRIGNSRGVRLPKAAIEQAGLTDIVSMTVEDGRIILEPASAPVRGGWEAAFASDPDRRDDEQGEWLEAPLSDDDGWTW